MTTLTFQPQDPLFLKAYCLDPPRDSCDLGPCPNSDVTGVGQQVSIYVTSFTFTIALIYYPPLIRPMIYAHLGLLYSLFVATMISIINHNLTQSDGVFALIMAASPASFTLWVLTFWSLWRPSRFPVQKNNPKSWEIRLLKVISFGSLAYWITMICVIFIPSPHITFSQPACNKDYGQKLWVVLLWPLPFVIQLVWVVIIIGVFRLAFHLDTRWKNHLTSLPDPVHSSRLQESSEERTNWQDAAQQDIVTWIEVSTNVIYKHSGYHTMSAIFAVMQLCAMPRIALAILEPTLVFVILIYVPWLDYKERPIRITLGLLRRYIRGTKGVTLVGFMSYLISFAPIPLPPASDIFLVAICIPLVVNYFPWPGRRNPLMVIVYVLLFGIAVSLTLVGSSLAWRIFGLLGAQNLGGKNSFLQSKSQWPFGLNTYILSIWCLGWLTTSIWSRGRKRSYKEIWKATVSRAHILKAGVLVISPNALWIQSSIASNPNQSVTMTFGQIFALVISAVTIVSLLDAARGVDRKVWKAFLCSEKFPTADEGDPKMPLEPPSPPALPSTSPSG
ncbi:hypothetical protein FPV67DRAFT_1447018 [Lyophyllum atratum]|nr:hypothetical protein FPV67DRAFT_1447018 [Lyophyllum atratum]